MRFSSQFQSQLKHLKQHTVSLLNEIFYFGLRLYRIKRLASEHHNRKSFKFLKKRLGRLSKARYLEKLNKNGVKIYRNQGR